MGDGAKVSYIRQDGSSSQAYIDDLETGEGTDKYTDVPVTVTWSDEHQTWIQTDTRSWELDWEGTPYEVFP